MGLLVLMMYSRISSMITAYLPILDAKKQKLRVSNTKKIMLCTDLFVIPTPYIISHTRSKSIMSFFHAKKTDLEF